MTDREKTSASLPPRRQAAQPRVDIGAVVPLGLGRRGPGRLLKTRKRHRRMHYAL